MPQLIIKSKDKTLENYKIQKGVSLTIGRRKNNDIIINDLAISGHHAKIDSVGDGFVLIDLQSKNGSFVNEQLINSHWLNHGDTISIGEHCLVFNYSERQDMSSDDTEGLDRTKILDTAQLSSRIKTRNPTKSITNVAGFWDKPRKRTQAKEKTPDFPLGPTNLQKELIGTLTYLAGGKGEVILARKYTTIGKHPTSDIVVNGLFIGQTAVTISQLPDGFHLCHVGGITKPTVNKKTIKQSIILKDEDIIAIGSTKLQFKNGKSSKMPQ